jgi:hypothetical protein
MLSTGVLLLLLLLLAARRQVTRSAELLASMLQPLQLLQPPMRCSTLSVLLSCRRNRGIRQEVKAKWHVQAVVLH